MSHWRGTPVVHRVATPLQPRTHSISHGVSLGQSVKCTVQLSGVRLQNSWLKVWGLHSRVRVRIQPSGIGVSVPQIPMNAEERDLFGSLGSGPEVPDLGL